MDARVHLLLENIWALRAAMTVAMAVDIAKTDMPPNVHTTLASTILVIRDGTVTRTAVTRIAATTATVVMMTAAGTMTHVVDAMTMAVAGTMTGVEVEVEVEAGMMMHGRVVDGTRNVVTRSAAEQTHCCCTKLCTCSVVVLMYAVLASR